MDRGITRRDILHGAGALAVAGLIPPRLSVAQAATRSDISTSLYPPALTGLRGSHVGSFEVAHELAWQGRRDWGPIVEQDDRDYDLVIVGAGISGLAAAHFYLKEYPHARLLILDNHDDFGGHAKRNEFLTGGRTLIGYGGSQTLEAPTSYTRISKRLMADLGIDLNSFYKAYDQGFFRRHELGGAVFFDKANWGVDRIVHYDLGGLRYTLPLARRPGTVRAAVEAMPMSRPARDQMLALLTSTEDVLPGLSVDERLELLGSISYRSYLSDYLRISEPQVFAALQPLTTDLGADIATVPAIDALYYIGLPGYESTGLPAWDDEEPYIHHFPDGNAAIARLLVRRMIPHAAPGSTMQDIVLAEFDYSKLDVASAPVRLRLNSTTIHVRHDGDSESAKYVLVDYVRKGRHGQARTKHCVLACYNEIIPYLCPEMPAGQRQALSNNLKTPMLYTNVALNNWRAFKASGVGAVSAPGSYHVNAMLDFPVDMGGYEFADGPDDPIILHMERFPHRPNAGLSKREQAPLGRHEMLATPFETIERNTREQLAAMLSESGFDPARDIEAITVNRWPHGYATRDWLEDDYYEDDDDPRYWYVQGRQSLGRIVIANSDAGAEATVDMAIVQAHRAVQELGRT